NLLQIEGGWGYFILEVPDGTEYEIAYEALNVDSDGMLVINEEVSIAVENYAAWKFAVSFPENYTPLQISEWKRDYNFQAGRCRGLAARRKFNYDREQIKMKVNQMVNTSVPFAVFAAGFNSFYYP